MPDTLALGAHAVVVADYHVAYPDPLAVKAGEELTLGQTDRQWPYIWCTNQSRKSGWVPEDYLERQGSLGRMRCDYSAQELEARVGDSLTLEKFAGGWYWASNQQGQRGWIPAEHVEISASAPLTNL